jgi:hypothetical protein
MNINLPAKIRQAIYIVATIATPTMVYLNSQVIVNDFWLGLYSVIMSAVTVLAAVNVTSDEK